MPNISKITLPNNLTYDIKDSTARSDITNIQAVLGSLTGANAVVFRGVSSTILTDGGNENPTIGGSAVTTKRTGDVYFYGTHEFIYGTDSKWHEMGSLDTLGTFAYISTVTGSSSQQFVKNINSISLSMNTLNSQITPHYAEEYDHNDPSKTYYSSSDSSLHTYTYTTTQNGQTIDHILKVYQPEGTISTHNSLDVIGSASINTYDANAVRIFNKTAESGETSYTPEGTVTVTLSESSSPSTTIKNPTKVTVAKTVAVAAPGTTAPSNNLTYYNYDSTSETLKLYQIGYTTGDSITTSDVSVKKGNASYSVNSASFSGTAKTLYAKPYIAASEISKLFFEGDKVYFTGSGTPSGTATPNVTKDFVSTMLNGSNGS